MNRSLLALGLLGGFMVTSVYAGVCEEATNEILRAEKNIAHYQFGGSSSTIHHANLEQLKIANAWTQIDVHLTIMAQNKCKPLKQAIRPAKWAMSVLQCSTALLNREKDPAECKRDQWKPSELDK